MTSAPEYFLAFCYEMVWC